MSRYVIFCVLLFQLFFEGSLWAQDGHLLIQQYREGPALTHAFSRWEISGVALSSYWIPKNDALKPKINYLPKLRLLYRPVRSMALTTGFEYLPIHYSFTQGETTYLDKLVYFSIPLGIRLFPYERLHLGMAFHYNLYQKGNTFWPPKEKTETKAIAPGVLSNSVGFCASIDYRVWKRFRVEAQFRFSKKKASLLVPQTNSYTGWLLGISHPLFRSKANY